MSEPSLVQKVAALAGALDDVPHAFGGALALAYYAEPRATIDIDLNLFVGVDRWDEVIAAIGGLGVVADQSDARLARRDGQCRVWWGRTPVDLFFAYDDFHAAAAEARTEVPFADGTIWVLGAEHLVACKAVFDRPKDWVDIDAIAAAGTIERPAEALRWVGRIAGDTDPRFERLAQVLAGRRDESGGGDR